MLILNWTQTQSRDEIKKLIRDTKKFEGWKNSIIVKESGANEVL